LGLTKTVQPAAQALDGTLANGPVFNCLEIEGGILAPAKDSTLHGAPK
jgi:hypothetical protein